ncbi:hypothetical protein BJX70DRAFT_380753 [Aspergillus crustosus]
MSQHAKSSRWYWLCLDTWFWEVVALFLSLSCYIAILSLLFVYDQKQSPKLPSGITLNTIVSILSTGSKSSLIFSMSSGIGQLKWIGVRKQRIRLNDIQLADDAGRGPLGSFFILMRYKGRSIVCIGAAVIVLALAYDPFMQQIISYPIQRTTSPDLHASFKQPRYPLFDDNETDIRDAVYAGIWTDSFETAPYCPFGNCTFAPFWSPGWCSSCGDVTAQARLVGCNVFSEQKHLVSRTLYLQRRSTTRRAVGHLDRENNTSQTGGCWCSQCTDRYRQGINNPSTVLAHAELDIPLNGNRYDLALPQTQRQLRLKRVTQCVISPCSRQYNVSVSSGIPSVNIAPPFYGEVIRRDPRSFCWKPNHPGSAPHDPNLVFAQSPGGAEVSTAENAICPMDGIGPESLAKSLETIEYQDFLNFPTVNGTSLEP